MFEDCLRGRSVVDGMNTGPSSMHLGNYPLSNLPGTFLRVSDFEMKKDISNGIWYESYLNKRTVWERMQM